MEKKEHFYTAGVNVNWYSHCGEQCGVSLKKLKLELLYDPAIPLLSIYTGKYENFNLKGYMYPKVHSSTIYNCQDMEAT